jgi:hypothetical protein
MDSGQVVSTASFIDLTIDRFLFGYGVISDLPNDIKSTLYSTHLHKNQQMHQNYHFIVMLRQMLLHVSAHQRHHQGAHIILTSYLYVGVHYRKNNGVSSKLSPVSIVTLWIQVVTTNCCWKQWTVVEHDPRWAVFHNSPLLPATVNHIHLHS